MDYPSIASRRNKNTAEGAIPASWDAPTSEGPSAMYEGTGNPNPAGWYDCDWQAAGPNLWPAFPKDSYRSGSLDPDKGGPVPLG